VKGEKIESFSCIVKIQVIYSEVKFFPWGSNEDYFVMCVCFGLVCFGFFL